MRRLAPALALLAGCNLQRTTARMTVPLLVRGNAAIASEDDIDLAAAAVPGQLKSAEGLLETLPADRALLRLVAEGYVQYAFGFIEDTLEGSPPGAVAERVALAARAARLYDRARDYALRYLATYDEGFPAAFQQGGSELDRALARLPGDSAPGVGILGVAVASAINLARHDPSRLVDLPKAVALLDRAEAMDPGVMDGVPAMVLGIVYAEKPAQGGRLDRSAREFADAIAASGGQYLMARVMYARAYGVVSGDRRLFTSTLEAVLRESPDALPRRFRLANELAERRAARYLAQESRLFLGGPAAQQGTQEPAARRRPQRRP